MDPEVRIGHALSPHIPPDAEVHNAKRRGHFIPSDPANRLGLHEFGTDQLEEGALQVGIGDDNRGTNGGSAKMVTLKLHAGDPTLFNQDFRDRCSQEDLSALSLD
jgi:hypothetical protein